MRRRAVAGWPGGPGPAILRAMPGQLYVIAAPSGAGKTSLVKALMAREPGLRFSVSYTTRPIRATEVNGRDYHFVDVAEFQRMIAAGEFLEYAQVFDNYYGTGLGATREALAAGQRLLLEIDWQGARQVRSKLPEAELIFILPPSLASLEERLRTRSTDSEAVIQRRLRDSVGDLAHFREFDFVVVNDRFETALGELAAIVAGDGARLRADRAEIAALAVKLLG